MSLIDRAKLVLSALGEVAEARSTILSAYKESFDDQDARALLAKGAERFIGAIAAGDLADAGTVEVRRQACRTCPSYTAEQVAGADAPSAWCGPGLVDRMDADPPTCGCLLRLKVLVGSEECPQGRW